MKIIKLNEIEININYDVIFISNMIPHYNCVDIGREWLEKQKIKKWEKDGNTEKTY